MQMPNPSPTLDKNLASMGPGILSSIGAGVWRKAPEAFADSNITLDTLQSATSRRLRINCWERGSGGVQSTGVSQNVRETGGYGSQSVPSPEKLPKRRDSELFLLRDLSHVVRCTLWDTPVPFTTDFRGQNWLAKSSGQLVPPCTSANPTTLRDIDLL